MMKSFGENNLGVHLISTAEYTLCGDALEGDNIRGEVELEEVVPTKKRVVTCEACKEVIELCRGVRTA